MSGLEDQLFLSHAGEVMSISEGGVEIQPRLYDNVLSGLYCMTIFGFYTSENDSSKIRQT
jgi:hypothetical protein